MKNKKNKSNLQDNEKLNFETGEVESIDLSVLNKIDIIETKRPDGSTRVQFGYKNCPTMAEQHTAHLTDVNYLIEKYSPDELDAYLAARNQSRQEIVNHDFASEPDLADAKNIIYQSRQAYESLHPDIQKHFKSHLEFLKFADNRENAQLLIDKKILTPKQLQSIMIADHVMEPAPLITPTPTPTPTPIPTPTPKPES